MEAELDSRRTLRSRLRQMRRSLGADEQQLAADNLCLRLQQHDWFKQSHRIALYLPNDGEIDPRPLLQQALSVGKECYLPVLEDDQAMHFIHYHSETQLQRNSIGILEPELHHARAKPASQLDLVLMPLVGFDAQGGRLGMGGGYYDRSFAFKQQSPAVMPRLVGIAHSCQQLESIPMESWDVPLDAIATDKAWFDC